MYVTKEYVIMGFSKPLSSRPNLKYLFFAKLFLLKTGENLTKMISFKKGKIQ